MVKSQRLRDIRRFVGGLFGSDLHAKRIDARSNATLGVMTGASLAVSMIGQALAQARGLVTKHAVKLVDRWISNAGIDVWASFARWVPRQIGRFGKAPSATRAGESMRRDRLLLISAFAMALLTLLGTIGESLGMDRQLKSNTSKTRSHLLFRQGCMLYELIPNMPEHRLVPLIEAFAKIVNDAGEFNGLFAQTK